MRKLFGTDGIRGVAGDFPLDEATVLLIGQVLGRRLKASAKAAAVVIGQDTRASSGWIADTLARGLVAQQIAVASAGVATTPAVAYLARSQDFGAGIVISASHNPWTDNGIKVFGHDGYKLADDIEYEIEGEIFRELERDRALSGSAMAAAKSTLPGDAGLKLLYEDWLIGRVDVSGAQRFKIVVDCANGAASAVAPEVMRRCGLKAEFTHVSPDGQNINENCGALHPDVVAREVVERKADLGICFDGDADRALFADAAGRVVNGDGIMLMLAREMKARGVLRANTLVATTMSNMGLEAALRRDGIHMLRAPVGDKYVLEEMRQRGATLGGEQSGHIIFADQHTTGDGLLTALRVIELLGRAGRPVAELVSDLKVFPQVIQNVRVREKKPLLEVAEVRQAIEGAERRLDGNGRVVVRYSGTEPLARVMVEAESESDMKAMADSIANAIQKTLGV